MNRVIPADEVVGKMTCQCGEVREVTMQDYRMGYVCLCGRTVKVKQREDNDCVRFNNLPDDMQDSTRGLF